MEGVGVGVELTGGDGGGGLEGGMGGGEILERGGCGGVGGGEIQISPQKLMKKIYTNRMEG